MNYGRKNGSSVPAEPTIEIFLKTVIPGTHTTVKYLVYQGISDPRFGVTSLEQQLLLETPRKQPQQQQQQLHVAESALLAALTSVFDLHVEEVLAPAEALTDIVSLHIRAEDRMPQSLDRF